mmetsp:Transcript_5315/g.10929  ORF Transcript_5315/g.10929 Transcript_5315/m.10929 type:complete len:126 (-) Transcript_5315:89-466(-)
MKSTSFLWLLALLALFVSNSEAQTYKADPPVWQPMMMKMMMGSNPMGTPMYSNPMGMSMYMGGGNAMTGRPPVDYLKALKKKREKLKNMKLKKMMKKMMMNKTKPPSAMTGYNDLYWRSLRAGVV